MDMDIIVRILRFNNNICNHRITDTIPITNGLSFSLTNIIINRDITKNVRARECEKGKKQTKKNVE